MSAAEANSHAANANATAAAADQPILDHSHSHSHSHSDSNSNSVSTITSISHLSSTSSRVGPACEAPEIPNSSIVVGSPLIAAAAQPQYSSGCPSAGYSYSGSDSQNHHFQLHLHNYLSSNSSIPAISARMLACDRAIEDSRTADRLFSDSLAKFLAGKELLEKAQARQREVKRKQALQADDKIASVDVSGRSAVARAELEVVAHRTSPETDPLKTPRTAIRTRFIDDTIRSALANDETRDSVNQIVLMGAALDVRAFRLEFLDQRHRIFELESETILAYKNEVLQNGIPESDKIPQRTKRFCLPVELAQLNSVGKLKCRTLGNPEFVDAPLVSWSNQLLHHTHFHCASPTMWIFEGNMQYFTDQQQRSLISQLSLISPPGSVLIFSHINEKALENVQKSATRWGAISNTFHSAVNDKLMELLNECGWRVDKFTQIGAADCNYGRWQAPVYDIHDPERGSTLFVVAVKAKPMKFNGVELDQRVDKNRPESRVEANETDNAQANDESHHPAQHRQHASNHSLSNKRQRSVDEFDYLPDLNNKVAESAHARRERIIDSWNARANSYNQLCNDFSLPSAMANRLVELFPLPGSGAGVFLQPFRFIDAAAGPGSVAVSALTKFPLARVHIIEPANQMLNIARAKIWNQFGEDSIISCDMIRADDSSVLSSNAEFRPVHAIFCSAAMHLLDFELVLPQFANLIGPGGSFLFNLWGRAFDETASEEEENTKIWQTAIKSAGERIGVAIAFPLKNSRDFPVVSREKLKSQAEKFGFSVRDLVVDRIDTPPEFFIGFECMNIEFMSDIESPKREKIIREAIEQLRNRQLKVIIVNVIMNKL